MLSPDGRLAALFNDEDSKSAVTVVTTSTDRTVFTLPPVAVTGASISADDRLLAVIDGSGGLHITNLAKGTTIVGHGWPDCDGGPGPVISADDQRVAAASFCGQVSIGRTSVAKPMETFNHNEQLSSITFNRSATRLALASWDSTVTVLSVKTAKPVLELVGHTRGVTGIPLIRLRPTSSRRVLTIQRAIGMRLPVSSSRWTPMRRPLAVLRSVPMVNC